MYNASIKLENAWEEGILLIIFGFILYIVLVFLLGISALVYLSPILAGIGVLVIGNVAAPIGRDKFAPVWWDIITVGVTAFATRMLWVDIMSEAVDTGFWPYMILVIYGVASFAFFTMPKKTMPKKTIPVKAFFKKPKIRIRKRHILPIVLTVMAGISAVVAAANIPEVGNFVPAAVTFTVAAIISWVAAGKKDPGDGKSDGEPIPEAFSRMVTDEYKMIFNEEPSEEYIQAVYDDRDAFCTYCEVAFDDSGRTYYYRTKDQKLKVGDTVYVPFGNSVSKRIGVIKSREDYIADDVPFPLEKTKFIIGKV